MKNYWLMICIHPESKDKPKILTDRQKFNHFVKQSANGYDEYFQYIPLNNIISAAKSNTNYETENKKPAGTSH